MSNEQFFDKTEAYKTEIEPILEQLRDKLKEHNIPFAFGAFFKNTESEADVQYVCNLTGKSTPSLYYAADIILENRANPMAMQVLFGTADKE